MHSTHAHTIAPGQLKELHFACEYAGAHMFACAAIRLRASHMLAALTLAHTHECMDTRKPSNKD